jgi:hypothetical protein
VSPAQASLPRSWPTRELRSPTPQLKREWSLWPEIAWIRGNPARLSKGYFVTTYLSSSPTCPATQSVSRKCEGSTFPPPLPLLPGLLALLLKYAYAQTGKNSVAPANIFFKRDWL